ncbi:2,3-bisphosphoglycerate-dependent phosphoglycerate mutase [Tardiphaga robiniae]|uniref:2,3-bisphosphoglycerate-dependent phosphoglycerate mutase n=1 Tax=Tardiphaga robiniae TaxID=943830 RepID=A0A7G6U1B2_9BRAD|nr:2,3-bisphosphoglycerate-dependent phosphoglycerate mutase [Tardiphaga robiniae]QND72794.1 2,3-bisphosphoglycerate-dependent phosphoglycerate mutase [Tardiphaga robiniae]
MTSIESARSERTEEWPPKRRLLVLARHGQSEGNRDNVFTGWRDLPLTERGRNEARKAGEHLRTLGIAFDGAFASELTRAFTSCALMLDTMGQSVSVRRDRALNERDYGDLTGLNKDEARRRFGEEQVHSWRRSYAMPPPNGESLRDTVARVLPFYVREVLPVVMNSRAVLVVVHGNSLRALMFALEGLSTEEITKVELGTAEMRIYRIDERARARFKGRWSVSEGSES